MKVLFLTNIPSPYRVDFFNELGKQCELSVTFEGKKATDRNDLWMPNDVRCNFRAIFLNGIRTKEDQFFCPSIINVLQERYDHIIVGGYSTPTSMLAIEYMRFKHIKFWIEADGGLIGKDSSIKYAIKRHFISSANGWLSSGNATKDYLVHYGARPVSVQWYPFTSVRKDEILTEPMDFQQKKLMREKLGMQVNQKIILSVGQFIFRKGFDVLLKAIPQCSKEYIFYIVGEEPTEEYLQLKKHLGLENVFFAGFKKKEKLRQYYQAADLFVLPTREDIWGLVVNEAMANGLPVITTDKCIAGIELVKNGENGYIVPVDNVEMLSVKINEILSNSILCENMAWSSLKIIKNYTIEAMARRHAQILNLEG